MASITTVNHHHQLCCHCLLPSPTHSSHRSSLPLLTPLPAPPLPYSPSSRSFPPYSLLSLLLPSLLTPLLAPPLSYSLLSPLLPSHTHSSPRSSPPLLTPLPAPPLPCSLLSPLLPFPTHSSPRSSPPLLTLSLLLPSPTHSSPRSSSPLLTLSLLLPSLVTPLPAPPLPYSLFPSPTHSSPCSSPSLLTPPPAPPIPYLSPHLPMSSEFHAKVGKPAPTDEEMLDLLRRSVQRSRERHYHGDKGIVVLSPEGERRELVWEVVA